MANLLFTYIRERDHHVMRKCHRWPAPRWVRIYIMLATRGGDGWLWVALAVVLLLFGGQQGHGTVAAATGATAVGTGLFVVMKKLAGRQRPCMLEPHCWAALLPPDRFSFPSGHSLNAFAISVPVVLAYPGLTPVILCCAVSIAISRVVLGMHFLSDVVVGAALGVLLGYATYAMFLAAP